MFPGGALGIPTLAQWKADTELRTMRSSEMKAIDKAIENYNLNRTPENIGKIRIALSRWIATKGLAWENSDRNKPPKRPISKLYDTVTAMKAKLPPDEQAALRFMVEQQKTLLYRNFQNAKLELPGFNALMTLKSTEHTMKSAASAVKSAGSSIVKAAAQGEVMSAVNELFGSEIQDVTSLANWVLQETGAQALQSVAEHVASMIPVISLIAGGAKVLAHWGTVVYNLYKEINVYSHRNAVAPGVPTAALQGLRDLLSRQTNFAAAKATISTAAFGANVGLHAAKGAGAILSPVVGAAEATAQAIRAITLFAMQVREAVIMHRALKDPASIGLETLNKAPLLGCYMLIGASDSELIAMLWDEFGQAGWMDDVTLILKDFKPLMDSAASVIQSSPFKLTNVPARRSVNATLFQKGKLLASGLA
ncbi:hypothetical protein SAMN05421819_0212 [Bryocella elongata]|uniref:Uncharacterized protein n=1 Tax=Bryocella elongata TaxID=863522 RepID=A0A1H5SIE6_9BACT|nr:hypothetical protein [Bryocella elongata]SEF50255.1 hypothetical protein SAMN05421819_0212 [Bryocella elongata]